MLSGRASMLMRWWNFISRPWWTQRKTDVFKQVAFTLCLFFQPFNIVQFWLFLCLCLLVYLFQKYWFHIAHGSKNGLFGVASSRGKITPKPLFQDCYWDGVAWNSNSVVMNSQLEHHLKSPPFAITNTVSKNLGNLKDRLPETSPKRFAKHLAFMQIQQPAWGCFVLLVG